MMGAIITFVVLPCAQCGVGPTHRGVVGVPGKGCLPGDQGGVLILPYGFILMGLEAFRGPLFKRKTHLGGRLMS